MSSEALVVVAVAGSGGASAALDLRTRRVPNWLTLSITALGMTFAAAPDASRWPPLSGALQSVCC